MHGRQIVRETTELSNEDGEKCSSPGCVEGLEFYFDDDESDWADVSAFEYADNEEIFWDVKMDFDMVIDS